mgnify:CR=1 FL=1
MTKMTLLSLIRTGEPELVRHMTDFAAQQGLDRPDEAGKAIRQAVSEGICQTGSRVENDLLTGYASDLAALPLGHAAIFRLLKHSRQSYFKLLDQAGPSPESSRWKQQILHFFDQLETAFVEQRAKIGCIRDKRLCKTEKQARALFDSSPDPMFLFDGTGRFLDVNNAACQRLGYSRKLLLRMNVEDVDSPRFASRKGKRIMEVLDTGSAQFFSEYVTASGEYFPVEVRAAAVNSDNGKQILSSARDISQQDRQRRALEKSEEKFRRIFENMEDAYFLTSMDGTLLMANPSTLRQLGRSRDEAIGRNVTAVLYAHNGAREVMLEKLYEAGQLSGYQVDFKRKDGTIVKGELNVNFVYNEQNEPVALEGIFRDVTDRFNAAQLLKEREEQYRGFFMNNHAIMLLHDPQDGRILDANPAAEDFYGYERKKLLRMTIGQLQNGSDKDLFREMVKAGKERRNHFMLTHKTASGDSRDVEVYSGPVTVNRRMVLYSVIHDVTERKRLELELQRMATEDPLTGVANRREFLRQCEAELSRAKRYKTPLTLLMLDLDHFKQINDTHGHKTGDQTLCAVTRACRETLRDSDLFGRIGGEEFAAVLSHTGKENGAIAAERLCAAVRKMSMETPDGPLSVTISIGLAELSPADRNMEEIMHRADKALYRAKRNGRDRVETA